MRSEDGQCLDFTWTSTMHGCALDVKSAWMCPGCVLAV